MRPALKTIETIERYLLGEMNTNELDAFEFTMNNNIDFKKDVELQKQLVHSLERISLQQTIQNAQKTYIFWKVTKLIGMILIPILVLITTWFLLNEPKEVSTLEETIPTKVEQQLQENHQAEQKEVSTELVSILDTITKKKTAIYAENKVPERYETMPSEIFNITATKDTIVETQNGIVFLIPSAIFVDENQKVVNGNIQLEIKEALDPVTIMTSGLSTLYNDKPLETGGMFFIEAKKDGEKLQIHPDKEITADIPTQDYKDGMQLFDGEVLENGTLNWTNPKPLNKALIPQDIYSLNFYPPDYLETLSKKGFNSKDKKFTDSLYYSFSNTSTNVISSNKTEIVKPPKDSIKIDDLLSPVEDVLLGLDPLKVKTIWNERYQNTFIATKAFEERLAVIHKNCVTANKLLDLYVNNLDTDLHVLDSIAAYSTYSDVIDLDFNRFAKQRLTNVTNIDTDVAKLNDYYVQQQKVYRLALEKSRTKMDSLMNVDKKYQAFSKQQIQDYYFKELAITTKEVAKRFDVRLPRRFNQTRSNSTQINRTNTETNIASSKVSNNVTSVTNIIKKERKKRIYRAPIRRTGWKNIDRILNEDVVSSVKSRTTTTVKTRKKSVTISYSDYEVSIENTERFDKLFVYLVPNEFNSFIKLETKNNRYSYKLNDLLKYRIHCIGYLNDVPFYIDKTIRNTADKLELRQITSTILRDKLASINTENSALKTEILYQVSKETNKKTLNSYRKVVKLKKEIEHIVFPCQKYDIPDRTLKQETTSEVQVSNVVDVEISEPTIPIEIVEIVPVFPGCENLESKTARKKCMSEKIQKIVNRKTNTAIFIKHKKASGTHRITTSFIIDTLGVVTNIKTRANHPEIEAEIKRVLGLIPKMIPASHNGNTVSVRYTLPIIFRID